MDDHQLNKMAELALNSPAPVMPSTPNLQDTVICACGKKRISLEEVAWHNTGVCRAIDTMCRECREQLPTHALVVCVGCKAVAARMAPCLLKSGFRIEPRKIYHTEACPNCRPDVKVTSIIEAKLFAINRS